MAVNIDLITLTESGIRYLRSTLSKLTLAVDSQNLEIIELRHRLASAARERFLIGRAFDFIPAAIQIGDDYMPGEGKITVYTVTTGLEFPTYEPMPPTSAPRDVLNFTNVDIPIDTFPILVDRIDDTGQLAIVRESVQLAGVGTLVSNAPAGTLSCPGGPTLLDLEYLAGAPGSKCYEPVLDADLNQVQVIVWNQCEEIVGGTRVQFKRVIGGNMIDVECCPEGGPPPGPLGEPVTDLGLFGIPTQF
jgi:hypothetical protein